MYLHPVFSSVLQNDRQWLVAQTEIRSYRRNDVVLRADERTDRVFCVGSGLLRAVVQGTLEQGEVTTDFVRRDDFFINCTLEDETYQAGATLIAALPSSIHLIPLQVLRTVCSKYPMVAIKLLDLTLQRTSLLRVQLRRVASASPEQLVTRALHELTELAPSGDGGYDKRISQSVIASYSGLSREQVNKTMRNLESRGLVTKKDGGVYVPSNFAFTNFQDLAP